MKDVDEIGKEKFLVGTRAHSTGYCVTVAEEKCLVIGKFVTHPKT